MKGLPVSYQNVQLWKWAVNGQSGSGGKVWPGIHQKAILPSSPPHFAWWKNSTLQPDMFCFCHSATTKNIKRKSLSCQWYFKRIPGLKGERKICHFSFICFVLLGFFFKAIRTLWRLYNQGKTWEPWLHYALLARTTEVLTSFGLWMAKGCWGWRAEQGCRESSSAMPVSCCLARRGLRAACLLHDSERFQGRRCAFSCRK